MADCNFLHEVEIWKTRWSQDTNKNPNTIIENLEYCNWSRYPGFYAIFSIFCVLPKTCCECERDLSALKREENVALEAQWHLNSISLFHIHKNRKIDVDIVVDIMFQKHRFNNWLFI